MKKLLCAAAALAVSTAVHASIIPTLTGVTPDGMGAYFFSYQGYLAGDQGLVAGDQLEIFNFAGYVPGSVFSPYADVTASVTTGDPNGLDLPPGFVIQPGTTTLVFTYTGPNFDTTGGPFGRTLFNGIGAKSTFPNFALAGAYSAVAEKNNGPETGHATFNLGYEAVPVSSIPEPAAWALMLVGAGLSGAAMRGRRRVAAA
jgi:hypothetical protein